MAFTLLPMLSLILSWTVGSLAAPTSPNPPTIARRALSGQATQYGGNVRGGACSFSTYTLPSGILGTALSDSNWDNSGNCGGCVSITGPSGKPVTAMIVDECPGCGENHLDLFPDTWTAVTGESPGVTNVNWDYIQCPIPTSSPLQVHFKTGVSQNWFSAQVVNANRRTQTMEVSADGGKTWLATQRQTYNFFQISSGVGASTVSIRLTSHTGTQVVMNNVQVSADQSVTASTNYQ